MEVLDKIAPAVRSTGPGKALLTGWSGEDYAAAASFQERLDLELTACGSQAAQENLIAHGVNGIHGDFLGDIEGSHRQFSLAIVSGPAVLDRLDPDSTEAFQRDFRHVKAAGRYLAVGGVLVFQTERTRVLGYATWITALVKEYANLQAYAGGGDEVIFIGVRRPAVVKLDRAARDQIITAIRSGALPPHSHAPRFRLPKATSSKVFFRSRKFNPETVDGFVRSVPWGRGKLIRELKGWQRPVIRPAFRLRARHLSYVVASGVLGTIEVTSPFSGDACIIRGVMRREEIASKSPEDNEEMLTSTVKASIIVFNTTRRHLQVIDPDDARQIKSFLDEWAEVLIERVEDEYPVVYDPIEAPYYETFHPYLIRMIDRPLRDGTVNLTSNEKPSLTIPQRHVVATALRCLLGRWALTGNRGDPKDTGAKSFFLQGKPGVGKSIMAARVIEGITLEFAHRKELKVSQAGWPVSVIVTVPGVINEMVAEIKKASRLLEPRIVSSVSDLLSALAHARTNPRPLVLVIPRSMLSQSQTLQPAYRPGHPRYHDLAEEYPVMLCPTCMDVVSVETAPGAAERTPMKYLAPEDLLKHPRKVKTRGKKCPSCDEPLYQEVRKTSWACQHCGHELVLDNLQRCPACRKKVKPRPSNPYQLGAVVKSAFRKAGIKPLVCVVDEAHQDKAEDSARGQAMAWFADLFEKTLAVSGTLYGGKHSTIFHLLYRLIPSFRQQWGVDDAAAFVHRYASWAKYWVDERFDRVVELPGISPLVMAGILLNHTIFLTLQDAGFQLPKRKDVPMFVEMDAQERAAAGALVADVKARLETEGASAEKRVSVSGAELAKLQVHPAGMHLPQMAPFSPAWRCPICGENHGSFGACRHTWQPLGPDGEAVVDEGEEPSGVIPVVDTGWTSVKERKLVRLVQKENAKGRPCLVYAWNTGRQYRICLLYTSDAADE